MGNNEFIKWTKFLDDNGAFSVADELENDFVKIAQDLKSYERDPNLPEFDENILGRVGNTLNYMTAGLISLVGSRSSLMYNRLANLRSFILSPLAKKDIKFRTYLWNALREAKRAYGDKVDPNVDDKLLTFDLRDTTNVEIWNAFGNWVNFCRQLFINHKKAQPFLSELTKAEQYLATLIDPAYKPNQMFDVVYDETDPKFKKPQDKQKKVEQNTSDPFDTGWSK